MWFVVKRLPCNGGQAAGGWRERTKKWMPSKARDKCLKWPTS